MADEVVHDVTTRPNCSTCGNPMSLSEDEGETWRCFHDKNELSIEGLERLRRLREEAKSSYVILVRKKDGKEVPLDEISRENKSGGRGRTLSTLSALTGGGLLGAALYSEKYDKATSSDRLLDKKTMDQVQYMVQFCIRVFPDAYPYGKRNAIRMLCPKCRTSVRADQQYCKQCGAKLVIPIPRYIPSHLAL